MLAVVETGPDRPQGAAQRRGRMVGRMRAVSCVNEPKISTRDYISNAGFGKYWITTLTHKCPHRLADLRLSHWPKCLPACEFGVSRPFWDSANRDQQHLKGTSQLVRHSYSMLERTVLHTHSLKSLLAPLHWFDGKGRQLTTLFT